MSFNSYWYIGLGVFSLLLLVYVCYKKGTVLTLLVFLAMVQCAYIIETVIYIFGESYQYYPHFIKHSVYYDSNLGALASNLFIVPVLATLIATFRLNKLWSIFFTALLTVIEVLFVKLHIYIQYWWKTWYTTLGLFFVYFPLAKVIYKKILQPLKGRIHSLILFLCAAPILGTVHIMPIMCLYNRGYQVGWFKDPAHDTTAFASIYYLCIAILLVVLVKLKWKYRWLKYISLLAVLSIVTFFLVKVGILHSYIWWDPWYYILAPLVVLRITGSISRRLAKGAISD